MFWVLLGSEKMRQQRLLAALVILAWCKAAIAADPEVIPPTETADIATIVRTVEGAVNGAYAIGVRPAMRDAHAKGHGCVRADFAVRSSLPEPLRVGVFAQPRSYSAWIRFSNGAGTPHDDASGDGRGMAIKLMGVPGAKLLSAETTAETQDFVMINYPVFFIRNVADYVPFTNLSLQGKSAEFYADHPYEQAIVNEITSTAVDQVLDQQYYSMSPYLLGEQAIKFMARPVDCTSGAAISEAAGPSPSAGDPNYLREGMVKWLGEKDACFAFAVQPQTDPSAQPIEDPTVRWDESVAPFIDVASIRIPKQAFDSQAQQTFCENLSFTPWHALPAHQPVGGINRLRKAVYEAISDLRHRLNKAPRAEPTGHETFN
jgi:hypothetical protein